MDDMDDGGEIVCPACGASQDAFAAAMEQGLGEDDETQCLYCRVSSPDDDWTSA